MSLVTQPPLTLDLPAEAIQSFEYAATGVGLMARALAACLALFAIRLLKENLVWALTTWKRRIGLVVFLAILLSIPRVTSYFDYGVWILTTCTGMLRELVIEPLRDLSNWLIYGLERISNVPDFVKHRYM